MEVKTYPMGYLTHIRTFILESSDLTKTKTNNFYNLLKRFLQTLLKLIIVTELLTKTERKYIFFYSLMKYALLSKTLYFSEISISGFSEPKNVVFINCLFVPSPQA